jgi:hypothetical protein
MLEGGDLETLLEKWVAEYGPFVEWQVPGGPPVLTVTDPDAIREVGWRGLCHAFCGGFLLCVGRGVGLC